MADLQYSATLTASNSQADNSVYKRALELNESNAIEWQGAIWPKGSLKRLEQLDIRPNPYRKQRLAQRNAQKPKSNKRVRKNAKKEQL